MSALSLAAPVESIALDGKARPGGMRQVPVERPVNIVYGNQPYAVMMATPADLEDFAVGFSLTEGIIETAEEVRDIALSEEKGGTLVTVTLSGDRFRQHLARQRSLSGRTGCGVCGISSLAELPHAAARSLPPPPLLRAEALAAALQNLSAHQPLNAETHAVHGAAWCDLDGVILSMREDVGRHNALDKLIGALLRQQADPAGGFLLITSRCSFEMVEKAARFGARILCAVSAPTSLALERAEALGLTVIAVARADSALLFNPRAEAAPRKEVA